jgi:hypothetical protein
MKKILKSRLFIFMLGAVIFGTIGVVATTISADQIEYGNGTVASAIDDLYGRTSGYTMGEEYVLITNSNTYKLPVFQNYTWVSTDAGAISIAADGTATIAGSADVYLEKNNKRYFKFSFDYRGPLITLLAGYYCTYDSANINDGNGITSDLLTYLTDGIKTKQGRYDALLVGNGKYLKFAITKPVNITFSSGRYGDSGGNSGATAKFYKLNASGEEELYTSFVTQDEKQDYITEHFDVGTYVLRSSNYVVFSEWTMVED